MMGGRSNMTVAAFLLLLSLVSMSLSVSYVSHRVVRIPGPHEYSELSFLHNLFMSNTSLDFWLEPRSHIAPVDIRGSPEQCEWLCSELSSRGIAHTMMIENVDELIQRQTAARKPYPGYGAIDYTQYHTYDDVAAWVKTLPASYPQIATLVNLGKSYEGRDLLAIRISSNKTASPKAIWFDGGIHAREWITTATVVYILGNILSDYGKDATVTNIIDSSELFVLPIFNPDGYDYTWTTDRMWRKTRSPNSGSTCIGTDPNRNWDYQWGGAGVSTDPCSEAYLGSEAFSEIEVKTVGLYIKNRGNFNGYINFHSYSQLWMSPWGYTSSLPRDYPVQNALSAKCVNALQAVYGTQYQYGPISTTIYPASGSSADYTYGAANAIYSYGVELRDTGTYGFLLPPDQIVPSGVETYAAVKVWAITAIQ